MGHGGRKRLNGAKDPVLTVFTSGSSGKKKRVPTTLESLVTGAICIAGSCQIGAADICCNTMQLFHIGGIMRSVFASLMAGGATVFLPFFSATAFWDAIVLHRCTWYYAAPAIHSLIVAEARDAPIDVRLLCNAAGPLLPSLALELQRVFSGAAVLPCYGMTECMPIAAPPPSYALDRPGCSGVACGPELQIHADDGSEMPHRATGRICVRGVPVFRGYMGLEEESRTAFDAEGWFDTGDVGHMDSDGYLFITGRSKEVINVGGETT